MNNEDHSLVVLIVYMLKICESHILSLDASARFQYISQGKFIIECIENKAYFDELVRNYLTVLVYDMVHGGQKAEEEKHAEE